MKEAAEAEAVHDAPAEVRRCSEAAVEVVSWLPGEANHGEEPTWAGLAGYGSDM